MLTKQEKTLLVVLVSGTIMMLLITLCLVSNNNDTAVYNNRILIIHTGGTIEDSFKHYYDNNKEEFENVDFVSFDPLLYSPDVKPLEWNKIVNNINTYYSDYDAFIIVHGKETLHYTASALSFMLENLKKPIVFTDCNISKTLLKIRTSDINEVMVYSNDCLLRACKTTPDTTSGDFKSPNYPPLTNANCLPRPEDELQIKYVNPSIKIIVVKLFPGADTKYISGIVARAPVHGIILETYGTGKITNNDELTGTLLDLAKKGVVIVSVSQTDTIDTEMDNDSLISAGVLCGGNMTTSAAFTKLHYLMGNVQDRKIIAKLLEKNFKGELD